MIAAQKKSENIAEYLIYLFQMEDLARTFQFDIDALMENFIKKSVPTVEGQESLKAWFLQLFKDMKAANAVKSGHTENVRESMMELSYLHKTLLEVLNDPKYKTLCEQSQEVMQEFRQRSNLKNHHDVEVLLHAMYMKLQLRIRKQEISAETEEALDKMRIQLAYLSREYKRMFAPENLN